MRTEDRRVQRSSRGGYRGFGAMLGFVLALGLIAAPLTAQRPGGGPDRAEMERRIQMRFMQRVGAELGIDSSQTRALMDRTREFQEERVLLHARERTLRARYAEMLLSARSGEGLESIDASEALSILDELIGIREAEVALMRREQEALLAILEPAQLLYLYRMREEFGERIREMRGGPPGRGPGGGPGGGSGGGPGIGAP